MDVLFLRVSLTLCSSATLKAVDAAVQSRQWDKAAQILEVIKDNPAVNNYYQKIAQHYANVGEHEVSSYHMCMYLAHRLLALPTNFCELALSYYCSSVTSVLIFKIRHKSVQLLFSKNFMALCNICNSIVNSVYLGSTTINLCLDLSKCLLYLNVAIESILCHKITL